MLRMTTEEYKRLCRNAKMYSAQGSRPPDLQAEAQKVPKPAKHRNIKVYVYEDGFVAYEKLKGHGKLKEKFDSKKEYQRCLELRLLEKANRISNLQLQTVLLISPAFTDKEGKKHQAITYRADFTYTEDGREVVEDVKGFSKEAGRFLCTESFCLKWKLLQTLYPSKTFRLY